MRHENADRAAQIRQILETEKAFGISDIPAGAIPAEEALRELYERYKNCQMCPLCKTRTQVVFGAGNPQARLLFVGEAPGFEEDRQGKPFVGAAGQLLTKIIQAMKLSREEVYIANCLKCRPPDNRSPSPAELATCNPILMEQIEIIQPEIICALGKFAAQTILRTEEAISRLRGKFFVRNNIKIMPTFHPAYLLRNPADKKLVWEDMKKIMHELGINDK